jgi:peptidyl-tRNA hydrolase, PTH2 family
MKPKQIIVMRKDLNMRKGKMVAQGAHASMAVLLNIAIPVTEGPSKWLHITINRDALSEWIEGAFTKVCVSVDSEQELLDIVAKAQQAGVLCALIKDSGLTEFNGIPTNTCAAIGPDYPDKLDPITGHLKLL